MVNFDLDPEQTLLRDYARAYLEEVCPPAHVRAMETDDTGFSRPQYADLGERGWLGVLAASAAGGAGKGPVEWSVLAAEAGRALLPGPWASTAVLGTLLAGALDDVGAGPPRLPDVVAGRLLVADALFDAGDAEPAQVRMRAVPAEGGWLLRGEKRFVQYGSGADALAVLARSENGSDGAAPALSLHLVPADAPGLRATRLLSTGGEPLAQVVFDDVLVAAADSLAPGPAVEPLLRRMTDLSRLGATAGLVGMSRKLLDLCLGHAHARRQFGRSIGGFQVIQHQLVDLYAEVERAQVLLDQAAWLMAAGAAYDRELAIARCAASDTSYLAGHTGGHIYGGYGFMNINDVQLYYRKSLVLGQRYGTADGCRAEIAELGYLPPFELPDNDLRTVPELALFGSA